MREGGQLEGALQDHLIQFTRGMFAAVTAVMPHAEALAHKRAHVSGGAAVVRAGAPAPASQPERPTQQVPQSAPPPPQFASDTQHLEAELPSSRPRAPASALHCSTMLNGSLGMPVFPDLDDAMPHQPLPPVAEGLTDDIPSASLQAEIEVADATEAALRLRQHSLSQRAAAVAGGNASWGYE